MFRRWLLAPVLRKQDRTNDRLEHLMATSAQHAQDLRDLKAQNEKAAAEQAAALKKLQDALDAAGGTTPEVDEAMAELKASIQAEDDLNPDEQPEDPQNP